MAMTPKQRHIVLIVLLGATLAATVWVNLTEDHGDAEALQPRAKRTVEHSASTNQSPSKNEALALEPIKRPVLESTKKRLFDSKSWYVPPPPPKALPPPPPSAPPLPFSYMGKMLEDGRTTIFLTRQNRNFVVTAGDTIESTYRVDEIGAHSMTLTYLPLNIKQTLQIGEAN
jgi:hypothetical protein